MTRDEAVALLKGRLSRATDTNLDSSIIAEMNFVQGQLLEKAPTLPWFLMSSFIPLIITPGTAEVAVPINVGAVTGRDFLREIDQQGLWIKAAEDTLWKKLIKDDYDALYAYYGDGLGKPLQYSLSNDVFTLHPTPDIAYDLRTKVYLREPALTTNIENKWLVNAADLLIAETGMIIASRYLRDDGLVIIFNDDIKQARKRLQDTHEAREHANRSYSMGGEDN